MKKQYFYNNINNFNNLTIKVIISEMLSYKSLLLTLFFITFSLFTKSQNPKREMRGVWVATVKNLDWPSAPGLSTTLQKQEIDKILTDIKSLGFNAVFLQVRPSSDAFYNSTMEPWSKYLTGKQGDAPKPYYDPLKYWIEAAKELGIEVHAWINPFRLTTNLEEELAPYHPLLKHPEWIVQYRDGLLLDPGIPEVIEYINKVIAEITTNYDITGIHMDDYFYPYPDKNIEFPDSVSYSQYCDTSIFKTTAQWRRDNVNRTVESIYKTIKRVKPWVSFGISPFGVWRNVADDPNGSNTTAGITNYDGLNADILIWLQNGWVDYIAPQIYWYMEHPAASFIELSVWWNKNSFNTPVYPGLSIYKIGAGKPEWDNPSETPIQIKLGRELNSINGNLFFRYAFLKRDLLGLQDSLKQKYYSSPALTPTINGNVSIPPLSVTRVKASRKRLKWKVRKEDMENIKFFVVYSYSRDEEFDANDTEQIFSITGNLTIPLHVRNRSKQKIYFRVSAVDKYGNEGKISKEID